MQAVRPSGQAGCIDFWFLAPDRRFVPRPGVSIMSTSDSRARPTSSAYTYRRRIPKTDGSVRPILPTRSCSTNPRRWKKGSASPRCALAISNWQCPCCWTTCETPPIWHTPRCLSVCMSSARMGPLFTSRLPVPLDSTSVAGSRRFRICQAGRVFRPQRRWPGAGKSLGLKVTIQTPPEKFTKVAAPSTCSENQAKLLASVKRLNITAR